MNSCQHQLHCLQNDRVLYRICNNKDGPCYQRIINETDCESCVLKHTEPISGIAALTPTTPSLPKRILTYAQAVAEWIAAGSPERSDKEVQDIYDDLCKSCSWLDDQSGICRGCGCHVADFGMAITNKIKMATQHCPREKW